MRRDHRKQATKQALKQVFPNGVEGVAAKDRDKAINDHLIASGRSRVSSRSIMRAIAESTGFGGKDLKT
jgi:hypothetical protein